jgi:hypothetical protein
VDRKGWAGGLPGLTGALRDSGAAATAGWLLAASWGWLDEEIRLWLGYASPAIRRKQLAELGKPLAGLLAAADGMALAGEVVTVLRDDVLACLLPLLRAAGPDRSTPFGELAQECERRLIAITDRPARADDDWSVSWSGGCGCGLCRTLGEFLADRGERTLEWPLAEARRKHVKEKIRAAELPVRHVPARGQGTQRRSGQPGMAGRRMEPLVRAASAAGHVRVRVSTILRGVTTGPPARSAQDARGDPSFGSPPRRHAEHPVVVADIDPDADPPKVLAIGPDRGRELA